MARQLGEQTMRDLAAISGVSAGRIGRFERAQVQPSAEAMAALSTALNCPIEFFYGAEVPSMGIAYRSKAKTTTRQRKKATAQCAIVGLVLGVICSEFNLPQPIVTAQPGSAMEVRENLSTSGIARKTSVQARELLDLKDTRPVGNLAELLERAGVVVIRMQPSGETSKNMDAFSFVDPGTGRPVIVLNTGVRGACRDRFNMAHELGHMLMDATLLDALANGMEPLDRDEFKALERRADRFAGELLIPESGFAPVHVTLRSLLTLKPVWRVSVGAMLSRSKQLGMIDESRAKSLWVQYSARGWRKGEPLDDVMAHDEPRLVHECLTQLRTEWGPDRLATRIGAPKMAVSRAVGLPDDFWTPPSAWTRKV